MALVAAIEQTFGISLSMDEIIEIRSVKDICQILDRHGVGERTVSTCIMFYGGIGIGLNTNR